MADQIVLSAVKSSSLRSTRSSTGSPWTDNWRQAQNEEHLIQGYKSGMKERFRSLLEFSMTEATFATVATITKAELHLFVAGDHSGMKTQKTKDSNLKVMVHTKDWDEAGGGEQVWTGALADGGAEGNDSYRAYAHASEIAFSECVVNVTKLVDYWAPKAVKVSGYGSGGNHSNYGMLLVAAGNDAEDHETVFASPHHVNTAIRPFLVLTVALKGGPGATVISEPNGDRPNGVPLVFHGEYEPGRAGDRISTVTIKRMGGGLPDKTWTITPNASDIETSTFAVQLPESLPSETSFTWSALVTNSKGEKTPYSAALPVRLVGTPPDLTAPEPTGVTLDSLLSVPFLATVNVPASRYRAERWRIQLRTPTSPTDPTWGDDVLWDSGPMAVPLSATERLPVTGPAVVQTLSTLYGGPALDAGSYVWRVQAQDQFGATSPWVYADFILTDPFVTTPGDTVDLTGYAKRPPFRIRLFAVDLGAGKGRGPGKLLAELTDAANVGAAEFYNSAGEFFFTIPATHPQVSVIEPYQVHWALEVHTGEGWRGKAYGLVTDFDATENEVVFYGTDYLGLLARAVEERFSATDAELPTDKGGAKYVKKAISYIITDQLNKAKAMPNSPVGFITVGDIASLPEQVTIYASFKQRLPFISGLIESARAGTGRRTRLVCERQGNGTFKWRLLLDPGIDRNNMRMEFGGLVQGFRTVPFGNWGTSVAAVGRTVLGTKVYSDVAVASGISEATYGHWPSLAMYADLDDLADLRRRSAQAALRGSKVGKQMGIGLRVGSIGIKDGWDIADSVPIFIKQGVVDTTRFGSGYWTIWGWSWRSYPDGHDALTLSFAPREDKTPPNPDLIPSQPILSEWQVGYGVPDLWGDPPNPTPPGGSLLSLMAEGPALLSDPLPLSEEPVIATNYMDLNTGCVYEIDPTTSFYTEVYCPPTGGGGGGDTTPPADPTLSSLTSALVDGVIELRAEVIHPADADLFATHVEVTSENDENPDPALVAPIWTHAVVITVGPETTIGVLKGVAGNTRYWARAFARDVSGNISGYSAVLDHTTVKDNDAPSVPAGLRAIPGFKVAGLTWTPSSALDLMFNEVRYAPDDGTGLAPDTTASTWADVPIRARTNTIVVVDLLPDVLYWFQVRAVDYSGNVATSDVDPTAVDYLSNPEAGWTASASATPTLVGASDVAFNEVIANIIATGELDASTILAGTLRIDSTGNGADGIEVWNGGIKVGFWDETGLYVGKQTEGLPTDLSGSDYVRVYDGGVQVFLDGVMQTAITPEGINATAIVFGNLPGGMNLVKNSSFELAAFATTTPTAKDWTAAADWTGTQQSNANATNGATAVSATATSY